MSCVLTLALDGAAHSRFEDLRQQWFPPERNQIPAHVTLFHTLPESPEVHDALASVARSCSTFPLRVATLRSLGGGVAFFLESAQAASIHRDLRGRFADEVSAQDRQGFRPHVVVQNKVSSQTAKETLAVLQAGFAPWTCEAVGFDLWRYLGGPWQHLQRFPFAAQVLPAG